MAGVKRCLGVDLGSHSVKVAEMAVDKGGLRIIRLVSAPVDASPTAMEAERNAATVQTVKALLKNNKITTKNAVFAIPGQPVFVRSSVRVPRAPLPKLRQMIHFEARNQIPFDLNKTMVEYQIFDSGGDRDIEVLLVAMKKDLNVSFMRNVRRMGLRPVAVSVSTLALFNGQEIRRLGDEELQAIGRGGGGC